MVTQQSPLDSPAGHRQSDRTPEAKREGDWPVAPSGEALAHWVPYQKAPGPSASLHPQETQGVSLTP